MDWNKRKPTRYRAVVPTSLPEQRVRSEGMMAKTLRIEISIQEDDGRTIVKMLEGEDAEKWSKFMTSVCTLAHIHRANPDWAPLIGKSRN